MRVLPLLPVLLLFAAPPASADALRCGEYRSDDGGMALVFTTANSGYDADSAFQFPQASRDEGTQRR